jgi:hypothetical protein
MKREGAWNGVLTVSKERLVMKTYSIFGAVGVGLFTLVVVCARGQAPKPDVEPSPLVDGSVLAPHATNYAEPHLLSHGAGPHHVPKADLWATYCAEKGCGPSLHRTWYPLRAICDFFRVPFHDCASGECTSCTAKGGAKGDLFRDLFGGKKHCQCPHCSGYAYQGNSAKSTIAPAQPLAPAPRAQAPAPAVKQPAAAEPAPVSIAPVEDEDPAPLPPRDLEPEPIVDVPIDTVPPNEVPTIAPPAEKPEIPLNEIPKSDTRQSSRRSQAKFAGFRLRDYVKTD